MKHIFLSEDELIALLQSCIRPIIQQELSCMAPAIQVNDKSDFLSRKQASELLGISLPTLGDYIKKGKVKAYRIGRRVRLKQSEIESSLKLIQTGLPNATNNHITINDGVSVGENKYEKPIRK